MSLLLKDTQLKGTRALPSAASTTVDGATIDTGASTRADFVAPCEFLLTVPALNTTQLPDTKTVTYSVLESANSDMSSPTVKYTGVLTQTGAGSAGAAGATFKFRTEVNPSRYVGVRAVTGSGTGDCSAASATLEMLM